MIEAKALKAKRISVRGVVQGVCFRPFVYRLAKETGVNGWVRNTSGCVEIEIEGPEAALKAFVEALNTDAPPMARIEGIEVQGTEAKRYSGFKILESRDDADRYQLVSPDIASCRDCLNELFDPADRRYLYPFTNCTNCGPRFTIIKDIPYDRPNTTMDIFKMCPLCQREYDSPDNRRFHAQPNACPVCGPQISLADNSGRVLSSENVINKAAELIREGRILAIRGLGGYQLVCDATSENAVSLLRQRKHRPSKPFAVMISTLDEIKASCNLSQQEIELLNSPGAPIVLLRWKKKSSNICDPVAPNNKYLGVMLPYTPLHHILLKETGLPLVMTSGNLSEEPIAKDNDEAVRRLEGIADFFIQHNREIYSRYDDSVAFVEGGGPQILRRARGYAPFPVFLDYESKKILACGAEEKNAFCITRDRHAFISQHIGDLENVETLEHFENTIELYKKLFRIEPQLIACDMHPDYLSTRYAYQTAGQLGLPIVTVQHHHAHIASCMAENRVQEPVIGVSFDGTGYGTDGNIWGGEFLLADYRGFKRMAHLQYVPMPGSAAAIKKPYRMALSYLYSLLGDDTSLNGLPFEKYDPAEIDLVKRQLAHKINSPLTSSAGRLFDAVSALLGVCPEINYSAQAAIELEMAASGENSGSPYPVSIMENDGTRIIQLSGIIAGITGDIRRGFPVPEISSRFHLTISDMILKTCNLISKDTGIRNVALSGGVFQNRLLQHMVLATLGSSGYNVIIHKLVPCNDGGIALGQAVVADFTGK